MKVLANYGIIEGGAMQMTNHKIVFGDSRRMQLIADKSVQLIVTSPPYWQLKDYGANTQIGFNDSYEEYINNLNLVWQECYRVLADGCRLCINIGDQFARSVYYGRYKVIPIRTEIIRFCEALGMDYMGAIIWQKSTTMNTSGGGAVMGSYPYPRNGILKIDYEFILIFKKPGRAPTPTDEQKRNSILAQAEWNEYFSSHWNFNGAKQANHLAMFPEELPKRLIKMFSFTNETVLDPFLGSGTTSLAAINAARNSIGYEINRDFECVIKEKLTKSPIPPDNYSVEFCSDTNVQFSCDSLPYVFHDPHKLDKKIDIKSLRFGSKIEMGEKCNQDAFTVKEIISPNTLLLNTGLRVKLLGIVEKSETALQAVEYLKKIFKGKRVFLKYDTVKHDNTGTLLGYVYLDNKTFVNNHLVRTGFVNVDLSIDYKYKTKFMEISNG